MKAGLFRIGPPESDSIIWVDSKCMVVNGAYKVVYEKDTDTVFIRESNIRAQRVADVPTNERRDYNTVINEFKRRTHDK